MLDTPQEPKPIGHLQSRSNNGTNPKAAVFQHRLPGTWDKRHQNYWPRRAWLWWSLPCHRPCPKINKVWLNHACWEEMPPTMPCRNERRCKSSRTFLALCTSEDISEYLFVSRKLKSGFNSSTFPFPLPFFSYSETSRCLPSIVSIPVLKSDCMRVGTCWLRKEIASRDPKTSSK